MGDPAAGATEQHTLRRTTLLADCFRRPRGFPMSQSLHTVPDDPSRDAGQPPVWRARIVDERSFLVHQKAVLGLGDADKPNRAMVPHRIPVTAWTR